MYFTQTIAVAILAYTAAAAPAGPTCASRDSVCRKYTANNGLSQVECDVSIAQCIGACQVPFTACQTAPDANHSFCASQLVACTGTSYEQSILPQSAVGEALTQPAPTSKNGTPVYQGNCEQLDTICRTAPDANMAQCSAEQAQCKDTCTKANNACRGAEGANMATCSADYASCLGKNPYAKRDELPHFELGTPVYQGNCEQLDTICRTLPGANMAQCSAEQAQCKDTCAKANNACRGAEGANMATCSADYASCLGKNPYAKRDEPFFLLGEPLTRPAPASSAGEPVYRLTCQQADTECRTQPGANMAQCSADKAKCLANCDTADSTCRVAPGANMSSCSAAKAQCYGFNPYN